MLHMNVRPRAGVLKIASIAGAKTANSVLADDVVHRKALLYSPPRPLIWVQHSVNELARFRGKVRKEVTWTWPGESPAEELDVDASE